MTSKIGRTRPGGGSSSPARAGSGASHAPNLPQSFRLATSSPVPPLSITVTPERLRRIFFQPSARSSLTTSRRISSPIPARSLPGRSTITVAGFADFYVHRAHPTPERPRAVKSDPNACALRSTRASRPCARTARPTPPRCPPSPASPPISGRRSTSTTRPRSEPCRASGRRSRRASRGSRLHYAVKANTSLAILPILRAEGASPESSPTARSSPRAPSAAAQTCCSRAPGRTRRVREGDRARRRPERRLAGRAGAGGGDGREGGRSVRLSFRINPGVDPHTLHQINTGIPESKFGVHLEGGDALAAYERAKALPGVGSPGSTATSAPRSPTPPATSRPRARCSRSPRS